MGQDGNNGHVAGTTQPQTIGRYHILQPLGGGSMARVWLCKDPLLRRQIVVKTIQVSARHDRLLLERFLVEAQASAALNHPHIVPIHDYGQIPLNAQTTLLFLVMPYLTGGSLADRIDEQQRKQRLMPQSQVLHYLKQAAQAIDFAHSQDILHRDVKPGNLLLRSDDWLMLSDFGLARILSSPRQLTRVGTSMGTPDYIAPEQVQGRPVASSDNYSLGVIAYQLLTGQLPFKGETPIATTLQHLTDPVPEPRRINPSLHQQVADVLLRALSKQPEERYASAEAFTASLEEAMRQENRVAITTPSPPKQPQTPLPPTRPFVEPKQQAPSKAAPQPARPSRRSFLIGGGAGAAAIVLGAGGWFALTHQASSQPHPPLKKSPTAIPTPDGLGITLSQQHDSPVTALRWSPTRNSFVTVGRDQQLLLWNNATLAQKRTPQQRVRLRLKETSSAPLLAWSRDGNQLAVSIPDNQTSQSAQVIFYTQDLQPLAGPTNSVTLNTGMIDGLTWLQDNLLLVVANAADPHTQQFTAWLIDTNQLGAPPTAFTIDARLALPADTSTRSTILAATTHSQDVPQDSSLLTAAVTGGLLVASIQYQNGQPQWLGTPNTTGDTTTWAPGTHIYPLVGTSNNQSTSAFLSHNGKISGCYTTSSTSTVELCSWTEQGSHNQDIATTFLLTDLAYKNQLASSVLAAGTRDGHIVIWDFVQSTIPIDTFLNPALKNEVISLDWSADGRWLAASYNDPNNSILLWKTQGRGY